MILLYYVLAFIEALGDFEGPYTFFNMPVDLDKPVYIHRNCRCVIYIPTIQGYRIPLQIQHCRWHRSGYGMAW